MNTTLNLRIIAVQDANGNSGVSPTEIAELTTELEVFLDYQVDFDICVIYPEDPGLLSSPTSNHSYTVDFAINLLVVPTSGNSNVGGEAGSFTAWASIANGYSTCIHELGHCFGLLHTFQPYSEIVMEEDENGDDVEVVYTYEENVTRDPNDTSTYTDPNPANETPLQCWNCELYGDRFCDTPADRWDDIANVYFSVCNPNGSFYNDIFDACGIQLIDEIDGETEIISKNYMSYGNNLCQNEFTDDQAAHMLVTIDAIHGSRVDGSEPSFDFTIY